ncbi:unnamed protein product [Protopolystoma xenopodis]|uniref:Uncharacterized protein n=1 Tax=Protopolystoma xenopodis TaxID=117903 RepID=A0A448WRF1_9PLAT|nr:unnamed protein product [Protopolystoma xenopodis]
MLIFARPRPLSCCPPLLLSPNRERMKVLPPPDLAADAILRPIGQPSAHKGGMTTEMLLRCPGVTDCGCPSGRRRREDQMPQQPRQSSKRHAHQPRLPVSYNRLKLKRREKSPVYSEMLNRYSKTVNSSNLSMCCSKEGTTIRLGWGLVGPFDKMRLLWVSPMTSGPDYRTENGDQMEPRQSSRCSD